MKCAAPIDRGDQRRGALTAVSLFEKQIRFFPTEVRDFFKKIGSSTVDHFVLASAGVRA
jgi:hypothetical protein